MKEDTIQYKQINVITMYRDYTKHRKLSQRDQLHLLFIAWPSHDVLVNGDETLFVPPVFQ